jgi:GNAT superfamily N-acetyltransferase
MRTGIGLTLGTIRCLAIAEFFQHRKNGIRSYEPRIPQRIQEMEEWAENNGVNLRLRAFPPGPYGGGVVEITDLFAEKTGTGAGTQVMKRLCEIADQENTNLILHPESRRNVEFYQRFGFEKIKKNNDGYLFRYAEWSPEEE